MMTVRVEDGTAITSRHFPLWLSCRRDDGLQSGEILPICMPCVQDGHAGMIAIFVYDGAALISSVFPVAFVPDSNIVQAGASPPVCTPTRPYSAEGTCTCPYAPLHHVYSQLLIPTLSIQRRL